MVLKQVGEGEGDLGVNAGALSFRAGSTLHKVFSLLSETDHLFNNKSFVQKTLFYSAQLPPVSPQHSQPKRIKIDQEGDVEVNMEENVPHHL